MTEIAPLRGLWCATLTPLGPNGRIDPAALIAHVNGLFEQGVDGAVLFGTTGEGPSFSVAERCSGLEAVLKHIPPACITAATGCAAFTDAVSLVRHALQSGCPRCLVIPPFFWKNLTDEAVFRYYADLIDTVGDPRLRLYLYHLPQVSAVPIRPAVAARLARAYPAILAGMKDSGGDFSHTQELLRRVPELAILVGHEPHLPRLLRAGGAGAICGLANAYPRQVAALMKPEVTAADEARVETILTILRRWPYVAALKAILGARTANPAWRALRPPLYALESGQSRSLLAELEQPA